MGVLVNESKLIDQIGLTLSGFVYTFKGSYRVEKNMGQIDIVSTLHVYLNQEHYSTPTARPLSSVPFSLVVYEYPADPITILYDKIKEGLTDFSDI